MFSILSRYLALEFLRFFALFLLAFVAITSLGNLVNDLNQAFDSWSGFLAFLRQTALLLPLLLELTTPVTVLLATIAAFSTLSRTSEVIAMRAVGAGSWQLIRPFLITACGIALAGYLLQNYAQPWMQKHWGNAGVATGLPAQWKLDGDRAIVYFGPRQPDGEVEQLARFSWLREPRHLLQESLQANKAQRKPEGWELQAVAERQFDDSGMRLEEQESRQLSTSDLPLLSFQPRRDPHYLPLLELWQDIEQRKREGLDTTSHWVEFFQKLAYPAQLFLMVALGALLAATHHRQSKAAESLAIAVFLGIISWILNQIFLAVGHAGALPPFLAAWGNCLLFLVLILTLARWNQS
ncbi:MAG: LptF/LptG family permease [SAR324 cluster bacterium]|nr:LptF/LptG family permease [SAR324 cluster bacterium]